MKIKTLVVEDNKSLNKSVVNMLEKEGFSAVGCRDVSEAKGAFVDFDPDIVLLDIMLPGGTGYDLIRWFRKRKDVRIIMFTALDDVESKELCYKNGADDYITKPFSLSELILKLNAIKRRIIKEKGQFIIGDLEFCEKTRILSCGERSITLQPSQAMVFKTLYDKYIDELYLRKSDVFFDSPDDIDDSNRIQALVARLRKNIEYLGSSQVEIETIYGKGYSFVVTGKE